MFNLLGLSPLRRFNKKHFKDISVAQRTHYLEEKKQDRKIKWVYENETKVTYNSKATLGHMTEPRLRTGHPLRSAHSMRFKKT